MLLNVITQCYYCPRPVLSLLSVCEGGGEEEILKIVKAEQVAELCALPVSVAFLPTQVRI